MDKIENLSSTPPGSSLLCLGNLRNPSCWSEYEYFYRHSQFHFLEIQREIIFFTLFLVDQNGKKIRIEIWTFSLQKCFWNKFLTLGSGQTENTQICVFAYFQFDHFPKSKIYSENSFKMKRSIFLFKTFFVERFDGWKKSSKMDFPLYFQKVKWTVLIEIRTFRSAWWVPEVPQA